MKQEPICPVDEISSSAELRQAFDTESHHSDSCDNDGELNENCAISTQRGR